MLKKIIFGGQTGVDQAALKAAIKFNIPHGGWCPKGRLTENGTIPMEYALTETESADYSVRTKLNIKDSDGTLILVSKNLDEITDGTLLTIQEAQEKGKPYLLIDLFKNPDPQLVYQWIYKNNIKILNIAGPRESQCPGIHNLSFYIIYKILFNKLNVILTS